jgi:hypothetical protein
VLPPPALQGLARGTMPYDETAGDDRSRSSVEKQFTSRRLDGAGDGMVEAVIQDARPRGTQPITAVSSRLVTSPCRPHVPMLARRRRVMRTSPTRRPESKPNTCQFAATFPDRLVITYCRQYFLDLALPLFCRRTMPQLQLRREFR